MWAGQDELVGPHCLAYYVPLKSRLYDGEELRRKLFDVLRPKVVVRGVRMWY